MFRTALALLGLALLSGRESLDWRLDFVSTFLARDLPQFGVSIPAATLRRFWTMLAHYHGQVWNASEFARSFGVSDMTVRRYLDPLAATFVVRILLPWHENLGKRQVKSPKVYVADSGLLHALLNLGAREDLERHPKVGCLIRGFRHRVDRRPAPRGGTSATSGRRTRARNGTCWWFVAERELASRSSGRWRRPSLRR